MDHLACHQALCVLELALNRIGFKTLAVPFIIWVILGDFLNFSEYQYDHPICNEIITTIQSP